MAEALGVAASVVALATLAAQVSSGLSKLRTVHELPGRLYALNNELADFQAVLCHLNQVLEERKQLLDDGPSTLSDLLENAQHELLALRDSIGCVNKHCVDGKKFMTRATIWWKEQSRLEVRQEALHSIKASINVLLGTSHS